MRPFSLLPPRRRSTLPLSLSSLALLAACGGEDGDLSGVFTITPMPDGSGTLGSYFMAALTDEWRAAAASFRSNSPRFRLQDGSFTINGIPVFANPLHSSRVDYAHAVGLSGAGQVIAVVDNGFLRGHEVFAGKTITTTGNPTVEDHGTRVASIAAGNSASMVGVAPGADLILSDWGAAMFDNLRLAADAARLRGAVAQNNSWGYGGVYADGAGFDTIFGDPTGAAWLSALRDYALGGADWQGGVVVFAVDNTDHGRAGLMDGLPLLQPDLETAWLAVGNALPVFDDTDVTAVARLDSSPCHESAAWCIMADGYWVAATETGGYDDGTGSSFAAPQVSGALALLAEAFPLLTPHELRARLLASADNTFDGFVAAGSTDLLAGADTFFHDYSTDFGHGVLDIRAALLPLGQTSMSMEGGATIKTQDYAFSTGGAMGDAVLRSLDGINLSVRDAFGGDFDVAAKNFATPAAPGALAQALSAQTFAKDFRRARTAPLTPLADSFAAQSGQSMDLTEPDGLTRASVLTGGSGDYGLALSQRVAEGDLALDLGLKLARDGGSLMGFSGAGASGGATMASVTVGLSTDTGQGGFFALSGEIGIADLGTTVAISDVSQARFNSLRLELGGRNVLSRDDRLGFGLALPLAVTAGAADMILPVAKADGGSEVRTVDLQLAPEKRQLDLSVSYAMPMGEHSEFRLEVVHARNYGNIAGASDSAAVIGMTWSF